MICCVVYIKMHLRVTSPRIIAGWCVLVTRSDSDGYRQCLNVALVGTSTETGAANAC
jgi:hypothetical protein